MMDYSNQYNYSNHEGFNRTNQKEMEFACNYNPYVYATLQTVLKKEVLFETVRGALHGTVIDVKPDHVVLESHGKQFFIRIEQIVFIMPL